MTPWILIDSAPVPGGESELRLYQRDTQFSIRIAGHGELMNTHKHGSEDALAERTCAMLTERNQARILIGGLGMGFTLAAALKQLGEQARVVVAELVPSVVTWNRGLLGAHAGYPVNDPRVEVREMDVAKILKSSQNAFDVVLLDVDNGPEGLTRRANDWLYGENGLNSAYAALKPRGILAIWSAGPDRTFVQRLKKVGFQVEETRVHAHGSKGTRHIIWFARRI
jgi:spermidine synthase